MPGASIKIPDYFFILSGGESLQIDGLILRSPKDDFQVVYAASEGQQSTSDELNELFDGEAGYRRFRGVTPLLINGLPGHYAVYGYEGEQYYEAQFRLSKRRRLSMIVYTDSPLSIWKVMETDAFREALFGLRKEEL